MITRTKQGHAVHVRRKTAAGDWRLVGTYPTRAEARRAEKRAKERR